MTAVIDLETARLELKASKGYRNWVTRFKEDFGLGTRLDQISLEALRFLALGKGDSQFHIYDLIMSLDDLGSGFEFNELNAKDKMAVMDRYLFLIDRIRFEYMKRLGWLESYPGEEFTLVELILKFDRLAPGMQARPPALGRDQPGYEVFCKMNLFEKEEFIRKLIPNAIKDIQDHSTTL